MKPTNKLKFRHFSASFIVAAIVFGTYYFSDENDLNIFLPFVVGAGAIILVIFQGIYMRKLRDAYVKENERAKPPWER